MQITNHSFQQTTELQHKGSFFQCIPHLQHSSQYKEKKESNPLKQNLPPPLVFFRWHCVNTSFEIHQEIAVMNSWHCRQSVTCYCFKRLSSRMAVLDFGRVLSTHTCPERQACRSSAGAEQGTVTENALQQLLAGCKICCSKISSTPGSWASCSTHIFSTLFFFFFGRRSYYHGAPVSSKKGAILLPSLDLIVQIKIKGKPSASSMPQSGPVFLWEAETKGLGGNTASQNWERGWKRP